MKQSTNTRFLIRDTWFGTPTVRLAGAGKTWRAMRRGGRLLSSVGPVPDPSCECAMDRILSAERELREAYAKRLKEG